MKKIKYADTGAARVARQRSFGVARLCLAIIVTAALLLGCKRNDATRASLPPVTVQPYPVRVIKPSAVATSGETMVISSIRSKSEATISAKTTGQIIKLDARVGDRVQARQLLVRIDASMASIQLQNARATSKLALANRANAKLELERAKALQEQGALSDANFDKMQMAFDIASAQVEQAQAAIRASSQQIADASILAPFAGVVSARYKNIGDTVSGTPPTALLSLVDPDHLEVRMTVPEALAPLLHIGDVLTATESPAGIEFQVRVSALGATVDTISRTVEVLADVIGAVEGLRPGALATVDMSSSAGVKGLYIPAAAWTEVGGKSYVFAVVDDHLQRKEVTAVKIRPGTIFVTAGISTDDSLALDAETVPAGHVVRALVD